jgi:hypothetical protein
MEARMLKVDPREYTLYTKAHLRMFTWVMPVFFVLAACLVFYSSVVRRGPDSPPPFVAVLFLACAAWFWFFYGRMPRRIVRHADGRIEFVSPMRRLMVTAREIVSIKPDRSHLGLLVVKCHSGKVTLLNQFDGFHELLTYIETTNPAVEFRGC